MSRPEPSTFTKFLRRVALGQDGGGLSDGKLLEFFLEHRDEAAFHAIVRRHGPMILGVCRRILGNTHDADDAFQATFLVFIRKADQSSCGMFLKQRSTVSCHSRRSGLRVLRSHPMEPL